MNHSERDSLERDLARAFVSCAAVVDHDVPTRLLEHISSTPESEHRRTLGRGRVIAAVGLVAALLGLMALVPVDVWNGDNDEQRTDPSSSASAAVPAKRPELVELTGLDLDGNPISTTEYLGQPLVLVFWGSWCKPCREQAKAMAGADGIQVLGVNVGVRTMSVGDIKSEPLKNAKTFERAAALDFKTLYRPNSTILAGTRGLSSANALPLTVLLDPQGHVVARWEGRIAASVVRGELERLEGD